MFAPITKFRNAVRKITSHDPEMAYLNGSYDAIDLERRQREIDAGKFRTRRYY
ncbi:DUF3563 domain-containing protein [Methylobrevis pamukkalensis]|uniref:DUF3563 domain-containing protein n=1 Tax=Methylobrevis pamukkalensis TaxID=1439726 RepID=A0A1E3GWH4_9HYPH|nr:DUF3563 domain-containing protein [Methylobrevis pamukkalensis]ODN68418.1 hypothetical protein A6302_04283 [Methylobrevis pamukkalensis]